MIDYNDLVKIKNNAPVEYKPDEIGVICFVNEIDCEYLSNKYSQSEGTFYYSVEFDNGEIIEIPERFLDIVHK